MLTDLGDLPISVWVEKESNLPVKYEMDMTAIMQSIMTRPWRLLIAQRPSPWNPYT